MKRGLQLVVSTRNGILRLEKRCDPYEMRFCQERAAGNTTMRIGRLCRRLRSPVAA